MSGPGAAGSAEGAQDPSMEEILASIRRILSEDETAAAADAAAEAGAAEMPGPAPDPVAPPEVAADDILDLDAGMLVVPAGPAPLAPEPAPEPPPTEVAQATAAEPMDIHPEPPPARAPDPFDDLPEPEPEPPPPPPPEEIAPSHDATDAMVPALEPLVAQAAAAAAAQSFGSLARRLAAERSTAVHRGGPTIEDLVREEIRPLLKEWLDTHLPPMVERMVRAEIERVTNLTQL
jgi:cell pole-organizing protein PopZ